MSAIKLDELRELIQEGKSRDPIVFLESIMNGQDPREFSKVYQLVTDINDFGNGSVADTDWKELVEFIEDNFKYSDVSLGDSLVAGKTLAEYLHPKRKQVELTGNGQVSISADSVPLTEEEVITFKEAFNDEF